VFEIPLKTGVVVKKSGATGVAFGVTGMAFGKTGTAFGKADILGTCAVDVLGMYVPLHDLIALVPKPGDLVAEKDDVRGAARS
jgi:hypothetical protein